MATRKPSIDQQLVRDLANLLNETELSEIEVEQNDLRIRVSRSPVVQVAAPAPAAQAPVPIPFGDPEAGSSEGNQADGHPGVVKAPMVGTVFLSPSPGAKQFVSVGDQVIEGQSLVIIEAMKTMNQIAAPHSGRVTKILVEDNQPVEYGEALMIIE